jgi:hypothetical protein
MENWDIIFVGGDRGLIESVLKGFDEGGVTFGCWVQVLKSCEAPLWADREAYMCWLVLWRKRLSETRAEQQGQELVI